MATTFVQLKWRGFDWLTAKTERNGLIENMLWRQTNVLPDVDQIGMEHETGEKWAIEHYLQGFILS